MSFEQAIPSAITLVDRLIVYTKTQTTKGKVQSLAKLCDETLEQMKKESDQLEAWRDDQEWAVTLDKLAA